MSVVWGKKQKEMAPCCGCLRQKYPYTEINPIGASAVVSWQDPARPQKADGAGTSTPSHLCNFPTAAEVLLAKMSFAFLQRNKINAAKMFARRKVSKMQQATDLLCNLYSERNLWTLVRP